ncbi:MAG: hypothetical protein ACUVYA_18130 [Planctomycetota bacterium]
MIRNTPSRGETAACTPPDDPAETGRTASRDSLRPELGAAVERRLLLQSADEDFAVERPRRARRRLGPAAGTILIAAALGAGAFGFLRERAAWRRTAETLERRLQSLRAEASAREEALRKESRAKDEEILERRRDAERVAGLAEETLAQLRATLDDFRRLSDEKRELERSYRRLLAERQAPLAQLLREVLPRWAERLRAPSPRGGAEPVPEGTSPSEAEASE